MQSRYPISYPLVAGFSLRDICHRPGAWEVRVILQHLCFDAFSGCGHLFLSSWLRTAMRCDTALPKEAVAARQTLCTLGVLSAHF